MNTFPTELKLGKNKVFYRVKIDETGTEIEKTLFDFRIIRTKKGDRIVMTLEDQDGLPIASANKYLNEIVGALPIATRNLKANAIKNLYLFAAIKGYDPENLTRSQVSELMNFLYGIDVRPEPGYNVTYRTAKVVNGMLSHIRTYLAEMEFGSENFFEINSRKVPVSNGDGTRPIVRTRKAVGLRTDPKPTGRSVKHIRPEEMKKMAELMSEAGDMRAIVLSELEYSYGLRSGEALGITEEDVYQKKADGGYYLRLCNRVSDKDFQFAKNLPHPVDRAVYQTERYRANWTEIPILQSTFDHIQEYIRQSRLARKVGKKMAQEIEVNAVADSVDGNKSNHYIFVGPHGRPYTLQNWNNCLRRYFKAVGIKPDVGGRYNNCSHRLRHGFAMFHAQYSANPLHILQLMKLMRHKSISSTAVYYTPLPEDEIRMRNEVNENIAKMFIPDEKPASPSLSDKSTGESSDKAKDNDGEDVNIVEN